MSLSLNFANTTEPSPCVPPCVPAIKLYRKFCPDSAENIPIRVDHVPTLAGENSLISGYDALGRLFAIGYLKGILDSQNIID